MSWEDYTPQILSDSIGFFGDTMRYQREIGGLYGQFAAPASGETPQQLVILLHGWGADGADLIDLAQPLGQFLPKAAFFTPDAPHPCSANPLGREWFDLTDRSKMNQNALAATNAVHTVLDAASSELEIQHAQILLGGFSQGGMMSLLGGLSYHSALAGIVSIAGAVLAEDAIPEAADRATPVLMIHGDADVVVPFQALDIGLTILNSKGYKTERLSCSGVGHGISPEAVQDIGRFAAACL